MISHRKLLPLRFSNRTQNRQLALEHTAPAFEAQRHLVLKPLTRTLGNHINGCIDKFTGLDNLLEIDIQALILAVLELPTCVCVDDTQVAALAVEASKHPRSAHGTAKKIQLNINVDQITRRKRHTLRAQDRIKSTPIAYRPDHLSTQGNQGLIYLRTKKVNKMKSQPPGDLDYCQDTHKGGNQNRQPTNPTPGTLRRRAFWRIGIHRIGLWRIQRCTLARPARDKDQVKLVVAIGRIDLQSYIVPQLRR